MVHFTTGCSPFLLMFGREPRLPIEVTLGTDHIDADARSYPAYVKSLRKHPSFTYEKVTEAANKSAARNKQTYDSHTRVAAIQVEDHVLVRNLSIRGKHKLSNCWEEDPCEVVECIPGLPVYKV